MASVVELLSRNNPVFSAYVFYATVLILKMLAMSALTARQRFRKKVRSLVTHQVTEQPVSGFIHGWPGAKLEDLPTI
jgi:uncharacterized paraquat-inducible protein A